MASLSALLFLPKHITSSDMWRSLASSKLHVERNMGCRKDLPDIQCTLVIGGAYKGFCLLPKSCSSTPHFARPKSKMTVEGLMTWSSALPKLHARNRMCRSLLLKKTLSRLLMTSRRIPQQKSWSLERGQGINDLFLLLRPDHLHHTLRSGVPKECTSVTWSCAPLLRSFKITRYQRYGVVSASQKEILAWPCCENKTWTTATWRLREVEECIKATFLLLRPDLLYHTSL